MVAVHNRTTGTLLPSTDWSFDPSSNTVTVNNCTPWHQYSVNFLAYRIWEEINMYNHITNDWNQEPLRQSIHAIQRCATTCARG